MIGPLLALGAVVVGIALAAVNASKAKARGESSPTGDSEAEPEDDSAASDADGTEAPPSPEEPDADTSSEDGAVPGPSPAPSPDADRERTPFEAELYDAADAAFNKALKEQTEAAARGEALLVPGASYKASITLTGIYTAASNAQVAEKLQSDAGPWDKLKVTGSDAKRAATGVYRGKKRTVKLPEGVTLTRTDKPKPKAKTEPAPKPKDATEYKVEIHDVVFKDEATQTPVVTEGRSPKQAALDLFDYASNEIRLGRAGMLGTKNLPNATVKATQRDMQKIKADGIYGDDTRKRGRELTGKDFPVRTAKPKTLPKPKAKTETKPKAETKALPAPKPNTQTTPTPAPAPKRSAEQAARDLLAHVRAVLKSPKSQHAAGFGYKDHPNEIVRAAQLDMGATSDGIYGNKTRDRGKALIGETFPPRA